MIIDIYLFKLISLIDKFFILTKLSINKTPFFMLQFNLSYLKENICRIF